MDLKYLHDEHDGCFKIHGDFTIKVLKEALQLAKERRKTVKFEALEILVLVNVRSNVKRLMEVWSESIERDGGLEGLKIWGIGP